MEFFPLYGEKVLLNMMRKKIKDKWQSSDTSSVKAPFGGELTGPNPTDRGKLGTKRSIATDQEGIPLSLERRRS